MPPPAEVSNRWLAAFYASLLVGGVALFYAWGLMFNTFDLTKGENLGIYTVVAVMAGLGLVGLRLYGRRRGTEQP